MRCDDEPKCPLCHTYVGEDSIKCWQCGCILEDNEDRYWAKVDLEYSRVKEEYYDEG